MPDPKRGALGQPIRLLELRQRHFVEMGELREGLAGLSNVVEVGDGRLTFRPGGQVGAGVEPTRQHRRHNYPPVRVSANGGIQHHTFGFWFSGGQPAGSAAFGATKRRRHGFIGAAHLLDFRNLRPRLKADHRFSQRQGVSDFR